MHFLIIICLFFVINSQDILPFTENFSIPDENSGNQHCELSHELPTFIRVGKVKNNGSPWMIHKINSIALCVEICRNNFDKIENMKFQCTGFEVVGSGNEKQCEFFDEKNDEELRPLINGESKSTYFEKQCLAIPDHCSNTAFSFELHKDKTLLVTPIESIIVDDRKRCLNFCLSNPNCQSVNYNQHNGSCQILDKACRSIVGGLIDLKGAEHYENTCIQELNACLPGQRVDFFVTHNFKVNGLSIALGEMPLKNCMRQCIDSTVIFCRSFEYNPSTTECSIDEESSELAIPWNNLQVYEPICLSETVDIPCTGNYVFERIPNQNLITEGFLKFVKGPKIDYCIDDCLLDEKCVSIVFDRQTRTCKLYSTNRKHNFTKAVMDLTTDLFELACDRQLVFKQNRGTTRRRALDENIPQNTLAFTAPTLVLEEDQKCGAKLIKNGQTLRLEYRSLHHVNVNEVDKCLELCSNSRINCATFAFNHRTHDCLLSTTMVTENANFDTLTQPNSDYSLFAYMGHGKYEECLPKIKQQKQWWNQNNENFATTKFYHSSNFAQDQTIFNQTASKTTEFIVFTSTTPLKIQATTPSDENLLEFDVDGDFLDITENNENTKSSESIIDAIPFKENISFLLTSSDNLNSKLFVTATPQVTELSTSKTTTISTTTIPKQTKKSEISHQIEAPKKLFDSQNSILFSNHSENFIIEPEETPRKLLEQENVTKFSNEEIKVNAMCLDHGVNVTFSTSEQMYTGAIYAAERFSQCRVLIEEKNHFSIFINRPSISNWCNALETDNVFTVILVLSNDMVLPFDVTTKDDFFYQITCDYHESNKGTLVHTGIVVSGPTPKSVMSSIHRDEQNEKVNFKILKNSLPVSNVFIGEKLTAFIQSEANATQIHVTECNATRVGGREPRPSSVKLISDGCSLMPQIISDMHVSDKGLEASLTAFRIDGSDEIDIACSVIICRKACKRKESCSAILERHRRTVNVNSSDLVEKSKFSSFEEDMVTVDQRLKVVNEDERFNEITASKKKKNDGCLNPILLLFVAILLLLSLLALVVSMSTNCCRKKLSTVTNTSAYRIEPLTSLQRPNRYNA